MTKRVARADPVVTFNRQSIPLTDELRRILALTESTNSSQRLPRAIASRYLAGDTVAELAEDYGLPREQIEWGIRIAWLLEQGAK